MHKLTQALQAPGPVQEQSEMGSGALAALFFSFKEGDAVIRLLKIPKRTRILQSDWPGFSRTAVPTAPNREVIRIL